MNARVYRGTARNLARLARALRRGELVAVPTETVYGLAGHAFDVRACREIFRAKGRPAGDPLIVHLHSAAQLATVAQPNAAALKLARHFWPGPLTLVLPKQPGVPDVVTSGLPSVAVRVPAHPLFRRLLKLAGLPLAAPSANPFGYVSPTTAEHVRAGLGGKIRHILDGGPAQIGVESTIVDLRDPAHPRLLRPGAITRAELSRVLGQPVALGARPSPTTPARKSGTGKLSARAPRPVAQSEAQVAPGLLARHYSPRTRVELHAKLTLAQAAAAPTAAWVFFARPKGPLGKNIFWLDAHGRLRGAAHELFALLRRLDRSHFSAIHVELAPGDGLADAINDRLRRAAAKRGTH